MLTQSIVQKVHLNNLLCYVVEQKYDKFKLACSAGILDRVYSFNSFRKTNLETNLVGLGQGFVKCNCNGKCATNRCGCFLGKIGCNTKCHPKSTKCKNKNDRIEPNEELSDLSSDSEE